MACSIEVPYLHNLFNTDLVQEEMDYKYPGSSSFAKIFVSPVKDGLLTNCLNHFLLRAT